MFTQDHEVIVVWYGTSGAISSDENILSLGVAVGPPLHFPALLSPDTSA